MRLKSQGICFVNGFDLFIHVIMLITFNHLSFVSFGTHILPDGPTRILRLPLHLSVLIING